MIYIWGGGGSRENDYTWAANATLAGCTITPSGIVLSSSVVPDASSEGLWVFDAGYSDSSGKGLHGTPIQSPSPLVAARSGGLSIATNYEYVTCTAPNVYNAPLTVEFWMNVSNWNGASTYIVTSTGRIRVYARNPQQIDVLTYDGVRFHRRWFSTNSSIVIGSWCHVAVTNATPGRNHRLWVNGVEHTVIQYQVSTVIENTPTAVMTLGSTASNDVPVLGRYYALHISSVARYSSNFSPTRFVSSGTVVLKHTLGAGNTLSAIDWSAISGAATGYVSKVEVNTGSDAEPNWVQVGDANPTPPLTGLNYTVPQDCVRFTLVPKADTMSTETPLLKSVMVELDMDSASHYLSFGTGPSGIRVVDSGLCSMSYDSDAPGEASISNGDVTVGGSTIEEVV